MYRGRCRSPWPVFGIGCVLVYICDILEISRDVRVEMLVYRSFTKPYSAAEAVSSFSILDLLYPLIYVYTIYIFIARQLRCSSSHPLPLPYHMTRRLI